MTPLETLIRELIVQEGPMRLDRYMELCLGHPQHGYYMAQQPFGADGDFITAPEVSQFFGELIGIWCIGAWQAMGSPNEFVLAELGPGRGTLMADVLRAARVVPAFTQAARVHLVETSPRLTAIQRNTLAGDVHWHARIEELPQAPMILLANEFFDALPIRQFERREGQWFERTIGFENDALSLGLVPSDARFQGNDGDVIEASPARAEIAALIGKRLKANHGAALIIDYGHLRSAPGDTLQALRKHKFVPVTKSPGACDVTSHVDFSSLEKSFAQEGAQVFPPLTQRNFLLAMGLEQRMAALSAKSLPAQQSLLKRGASRLVDEDQMGNLFKVLAVVSPGLDVPYPFGG
ncbi:class I SAM-dependent methyltransferase [Aestuariivirga sp.]|uniref:class I SAM-dependent methyltransferase n=1 Tax=Aestuariivirga sp. TaxID=2650926 RepID=UPI0039E7199D